MKSGIRAVVLIINILYPFAVFAGLVFLQAPLKVFPFALAGILLLNVFSDFRSLGKANPGGLIKVAGMALAVISVVILMTVTENAGYAKLYPVIINVSLLTMFAASLIRPPTVIWRFATIRDKTLEDHPDRERAVAYCRRVTVIWCGFFITNTLISLATALWASDAVWSLYNGMISYIVMGVLLLGEFLVRRSLRIGR